MFWSVIIPVKRPAMYLEQSLRSCRSQLLSGGDGEVLLQVQPEEIGPPFFRNIPGVSVEYNQSDLGCYGSVNAALKRARGDWVHVLHDDDWVLPGFYDEMRDAVLHKFPPGTVAASCLYGNHDQESGELTRPSWMRSVKTGVMTGWVRRSLTRGNPFQVCSVVFNRQIALAVGFREDMPFAADWEFYTRLARQGEWGYVAKDLARYRVHKGQRAWAMFKDGRAARDCQLARQLAT